MLKTLSRATLTAKICLPVATALLLFSTGCGRDHCNSCSACTTAQSDSQQYNVAYVEQIPSYSGTQPATAYVPPTQIQTVPVPNYSSGLKGPRSQAEIDNIYNSIRVQPIPPPPPPVVDNTPVAPAPAGEAAWNVPLSREWRHIVVHHSASASGSAASFDKAHRDRGWDGLGYHFVIGNGSGSGDGVVEVGYRWTKQQAGAHAGNYEYNQHGVGICLVGDFEHNGPPSARQMASLRSLIGFLQAKANIPASQIIGHGSVPGRNTECPGRHLDMNSLRASSGGAVTMSKSTPPPAPAAPVAPSPAPEMALIDKPATAILVKNAVTAAKPELIKTVAKP